MVLEGLIAVAAAAFACWVAWYLLGRGEPDDPTDPMVRPWRRRRGKRDDGSGA